ncbi:glycosyltransferase family 39 protein [Candidatus Berkelbacteria bacterium]|nr:glycosyltransferase family 39 protein [Candidatus Berkelbacteria bacterium]
MALNKTDRIYIGIIALVGYLIYVQTIGFGLTYLDDNVLVGSARELGRAQTLVQAFIGDPIHAVTGGFYYRPAVVISYWLNAAIGGGGLAGYHVLNILLHVAVGVALYVLLRQLAMGAQASLFASLLLMVHPLTAQAVAWIPGRNELLLALFWIMSFGFLAAWLREGKGWLLAGHLAAYGLALLSKEVALAIVPIGLIGLMRPIGRMGQIRFIRPIGLMGLLAGWVMITVAWAALRAHAINSISPIGPISPIGLMGLMGQIGKLILPVHLSTYPIGQDMNIPIGLMSLIGLMGLIRLMRQIGSMRLIRLMGLLWIAVALASTLLRPNIGQPGLEFLEHRLYLGVAGVAMIIGLIGQIIPIRLIRSIGLIGLIGLMGLNFTNTRHYRDGMSYWKRAVETSPHSAFARNQLGVMDYFAHDLNGAAGEYTVALELNPSEPLAHNNLGVVYMDEGKFRQAKNEFNQELRINPGYENAIKNLKMVQLREN